MIFPLCLLFLFHIDAHAQISPGELSSSHAQLEGMSNCTKCHNLGHQVRNIECLACHEEITTLQKEGRGYHASSDVAGHNCIQCHSEHHGRNFRIINFNPKAFDHSKTTFILTGKHLKSDCFSCHKAEFIKTAKKNRSNNSYIGLLNACASCHRDVHNSTLGNNCDKCHDTNSFKPAPKFNHNNTFFKLEGAHSETACIKCHPIETKNNLPFQKFKGLKFNSCSSCHKDVHNGKFGSDCTTCHITESFKKIKNINSFDHTKTNYPLLGRHNEVQCKKCHTSNYTAKLKYNKCNDCHTDYHLGQFLKNNVSEDCVSCHDVNGFNKTSFTIDRHLKNDYQLTGAHLAVPCENCHKKGDKWVFRPLQKTCADCHKNVHGNTISKKFYDNGQCNACHNTGNWNEISFDHSKTKFQLSGKHSNVKCKNCHTGSKMESGIKISFKSGTECAGCHKDPHFGQFAKNGIVSCEECHKTDNWNAPLFDHNKASFRLDGAHKNVPCIKCHKEVIYQNNKYIKYKYDVVKCVICHS